MHITFGAADGAVTAHLPADAPPSARRLLEQNGATVLKDGGYVFKGDDGVARAARVAFLVAEAHRDDPLADALAGARTAEADVVFARHPDLGIVAATASDSTVGLIPEVLRTVGWHYDGSAPDRRIYLPSQGAHESEVRVAAARAAMALQNLGLRVATVGLAPEPGQADLAEAAADLRFEQGAIRSLTDTRDVADVLDAALDPKTGALPALDELLASVAEFVQRLPEETGEILGAQVGIARHQATALGQTVAGVQEALVTLATTVEAPISVARSPRATAAMAVSALGLPAGPIIQAAPAAHTLSTAPAPAATR